MKECLLQLITGKDNQTHDLGRWSWVVCVVSVIASAIWNAMHSVTIDLLQLAQALGVIVAAHGGALFLKKDTEPEVK